MTRLAFLYNLPHTFDLLSYIPTYHFCVNGMYFRKEKRGVNPQLLGK
jgi:hypothetical protein